MKSVTINLAAAWSAAIQTFVDGDVFRESNIDLNAGAIADRLGYLKTTVDGKASIAGANTFTGNNEFDTDAGTWEVSGGGDAVFTCSLLDANCNLRARSSAVVDGSLELLTTLVLNSHVLPDASGTLPVGNICYRVPALTANRAYGTPAASPDGKLLIFTRPRTADSFTAGLTGIGTVPVSEAGFIVAIVRGGAWVPVLWSSNITGLSTAV
jgi:hypothetical protein